MDTTTLTIEQIQDFLKGTDSLSIVVGESIEEKYAWIESTLIKTRYQLETRDSKSLIRRYIIRCTGYTMSHIDHKIHDFKATGRIKRQSRECSSEYTTFYTNADIVLLAEVSEAYFHPNGKALTHILHDMYHVYGEESFERLSKLSVSRLYDFRKTTTYTNAVLTYTKTKPSSVSIGERKKPYPEGQAGFIRVDSVHQGDRDKEKGVYHIHLVDEVTQFDVQLAVSGISEQFLLPILEEALSLFPFRIQNFHSDNGSEYINKMVAGLLEKLLITQTKSRSRRTNDNALIEGKHAATVRPVYGNIYIPRCHAETINDFNREHLIPFLNYHRKCAFPTELIDTKGKIKKIYDEYRTPVEKLLSLPRVEVCLKEGVTVDTLRGIQHKDNHFAVAKKMQEARTKLFKTFTK